jgi:hypothetical protein
MSIEASGAGEATISRTMPRRPGDLQRFLPVRLIGYLVLMATAAILIWTAPSALESTVSAVVQAVATIVLAAVGIEALLFNRELVSATQTLAEETSKDAEAAIRAADAATASVSETRRQALIGSVPFVRVERPYLDNDPADGSVVIEVPVQNLGPGPAMEVRLSIEVRDRGIDEFREYLQGAWSEALLDDQPESSFGMLHIRAHDLTNMARMGWRRIRPTDLGTATVEPPPDLLIPAEIRVHISWMSTRGAHAEQVLLWRTEDVTLIHPWTWRFESLRVDPGRDEGGHLHFEAPNS